MIQSSSPLPPGYSWRAITRGLTVVLLVAVAPLIAAVGGASKITFDIPAATAAQALKKFSSQSGQQLLYSNTDIAGITTNEVKGEFTSDDALTRLLAGTSLVATRDSANGAVAIGRGDSHPNGQRAAQATASDRPANLGQPGGITGTVSNAATGTFLEGAQVTLTPGEAIALTTRDGRFSFPRVAPGDYALAISYAGLDSKTVPVNVMPGVATRADVALTAAIYQLSTFVVEGEREGNAAAIVQQRNAANVKNVLSSDAFGNVADFNLGNFLQRIPGFSTEISEGEIVRVQIRGAGSDLSSVSIDGTRAANGATRTFGRGFDINTIPTEFIETIEVTKAATPDMDADSIGGAVNLKAKSALDRKGRRTNYAYGYSYNWEQKTFRPAGNVGYSDVLLDGKLGVLFTASYNETHQPRNANGITWQATTDLSKPAWFNADTFGQDQVKHTRAGSSLRFDYKLGDATRIFLSTQWSYYYDQLNRRWGRLSTLAATNVLAVTDRTVDTRNQTFTYYQTLRNRDLITTNVMLGGESSVLGGKLDFTANYSPSKGTDRDRLFPQRTVAGVGFHEERGGDHKFITLTQISGPDILDPRNSLFNSFDIPDTVSHDRVIGAQINFKRPVPFPVPLALKTGARFREQRREQDNTRRLYAYVGPNGVAGPVGANNDDNLQRLFDTDYRYQPNGATPVHAGLNINDQFFNLPLLEGELHAHPELFREDLVSGPRDSIRNDNTITEQVTAVYLQGELKLGRLGVLGGVRLEDTRIHGDGYKQEITPPERARRAAFVGAVTPAETLRRTLAEFGNPTSSSGRYHSFFPSLHLKYQLTSNLLARASYSNGIGRPNFGSIVPTTTVNNDNLTISANNPGLKPQYSDSYDVTLEYYFRPAGLASVAVFEKRITDFIFTRTGLVLGPGNEFGENYNGYTLTTQDNGGSARIRGLEASLQQQFSNLPGIWKRFGAFANFTWQETRGDYGTPGAVTTQHELANFTPRGGNAGITYTGHPWMVRVLANHTGERLLAYTADPSQRQYLMKATPIDINATYALNRYVSLYLDVINLFNAGRQYQYRWIPDHRSDTWVYTTFVKFGVRGAF
jgi:TonB-dependent receptor